MRDGYSLMEFSQASTLKNWKDLFSDGAYMTPLLKTVIIVAVNVVVMPLASSLCAYSFARTKWKGKELTFVLMLATMMIPASIVQLPLYVLFSKLGWLNSVLPLTVPNLFGGGAINIFLFRQYIRSLPKELEEAAKIDGANALRRYARVTLPLCKPILIFVAVNAFTANWSDFMSPLIYMTSEDSYTLAVAIYQNTVGVRASAINVRMAAGVFMSVPPAIIFLLFQKNLIDGLTVGAVKG
jgi:multiple sugar transport system permease protein